MQSEVKVRTVQAEAKVGTVQAEAKVRTVQVPATILKTNRQFGLLPCLVFLSRPTRLTGPDMKLYQCLFIDSVPSYSTNHAELSEGYLISCGHFNV